MGENYVVADGISRGRESKALLAKMPHSHRNDIRGQAI